MRDLNADAIRSEVEAVGEAFSQGHNVDVATALRELLAVADRLEVPSERMKRELAMSVDLKEQAETLRKLQEYPHSFTDTIEGVEAVRICILKIAGKLELGL